MRRRTRVVVRVSAGLVTALVITAAGYGLRNVNFADWNAAQVTRAGFTEKEVTIDGSRLNYAEGPDNAPPLLLIHGQLTDWRSWSPVLPELSNRYHVFAIDCYGHGRSDHAPDKYSGRALAADAKRFLTQVIGRPATVAGHYSGGLVAAILAADAPEMVRAVVLEDPPFFSSVLPRATRTFNYVGLATTTHDFLASGETDFIAFYIRHSAIWDLFKGLKGPLQNMALSYRKNHPGEPVKFVALPPTFNGLFRAMESYDPRFGETFYDNSFHVDFDHAQTLAGISVPTALIHTNWSYDDSGILLAAMDGDDAERARTLLKDVEFYRVDTGHGFHFEDPDHFVEILRDLEQRVGNRAGG
jgi:pimeloyl-ACP methyl ester carboxylesterase